MKKVWLLVLVLAAVMTFSACRLYTVVPMEEKTEEGLVADQKDQDLDPALYVEETWEQIESHTVDNAADIGAVIALLGEDKAQCVSEYSASDVSEVETATFIVSGSVTVLDVDRESKVGKMAIDVQPYDGEADALVQIGTVYKENIVRDTMPFITFEDFKNQLAFGDIGKAINAYIDENVVVPMNLEDKIGSEIVLTGIFPDDDEVIITPVKIEE